MSTATITCPSWCQQRPTEHEWESEHGYPVQHYRWFRAEGGWSVCLETTDDQAEPTISIEDDIKLDLATADALAQAILAAVKEARA